MQAIPRAAVGKGGSWLKKAKGLSIHVGADSKGLMLQIGAAVWSFGSSLRTASGVSAH